MIIVITTIAFPRKLSPAIFRARQPPPQHPVRRPLSSSANALPRLLLQDRAVKRQATRLVPSRRSDDQGKVLR